MAAAVEPGPPSAVLRVRRGSARARAWNQTVRAVVHPETPEKLPFFCECGMGYCHSRVWLTLAEARDLIDGGGLIIGAHIFSELEARRSSVRDVVD